MEGYGEQNHWHFFIRPTMQSSHSCDQTTPADDDCPLQGSLRTLGTGIADSATLGAGDILAICPLYAAHPSTGLSVEAGEPARGHTVRGQLSTSPKAQAKPPNH